MPKNKSKRKGSVDYVELSREHKKLVRRLVSPRDNSEDWEIFYSTIREMVTARHEKTLEDEASISVEEFMRGELTEFLRANKCERLRQFLNLKSENSDHQHLFGKWFAKVLKSARDAAAIRRDREISGDGPHGSKGGDSAEKSGGSTRSLIDNIASDHRFEAARMKDIASLPNMLRSVGGSGFSKLIAKFWGKYPQETYIALMDAQLNYHYRKIAALLGKPDSQIRSAAEAKKEEVSISGKLRNLRRKFYAQLTLRDLETMFPFLKGFPEDKLRATLSKFIKQQGEAFFGADGVADVDLVEGLGSAYGILYFRSVKGDWQLELKLPFEVSDKALIRGVFSDGKGGVPKGVLFCCGAKRKIRANGHFEFPVSEFKKFSDSSELHFTASGGRRSDGVPFVPEEFDELCPTLEQLETWAARKMSDSSALELTADLLDDFGYVLPQLMLKDEALDTLPFGKFGVPRIDRKHLRREYNEALVLFRAEIAVDPDSPLSADGFVLPLEWRYNPYAAEVPSRLLPLHLSSLGRRVAACMQRSGGIRSGDADNMCKWQLQPSMRFFDDRVDFSSPGLLGTCETEVASATGALAVALKYAQGDVQYAGWPFVSLKYDFTEQIPKGVGGIAQKMAVVAEFGGDKLFVAPDQHGIPAEHDSVVVKKVTATTLDGVADEVAFEHLDRIRPSRPLLFKTVPEDILAPRRNISDDLCRMAKAKELPGGTGPFVVLWGGPGMGKSVLMWLLYKSCTTTHRVFGYVCRAGCMNQGWEFVRSLAHGLASTCGGVTDDVLSVPLPAAAPVGDALRDIYRRLVFEPVCKAIASHRGERLFILVDGLDEDMDGDVVDLLLDPQLRFPARVSVVVSSRRIVQDEERLGAVATDVIDLDEQNTKCARDVRMDVRTYIDQWTGVNENVYQRLLDSNIDSEALKDAILEKDRSFLYASYVLSGIADGRYGIHSVEELERDLPKDLKSCLYDAFKARFPTGATYDRVKPLLRLLVRKGRVEVAEAGRKAIVGEETLGAVLRALRGYAVEEGGEICLSSEVLRMWLKDATHNAEFGV